MNFKTPSFWYQPWEKLPQIIHVLSPLGRIYGAVTKWRIAYAKPVKVSVPVICVGNLVAGGSGKTPTALALMTLLKQSGITKNPCFLTRGYGGQMIGPLFVSDHGYVDVGDEALLLSRMAPTIVSQERVPGARLAAQSGHDLIIMDDGFQNPSLHKDKGLLVVDGRTLFGNNYLIPIGPLREEIAEGMKRTDAVVKIGGDTSLHTNKPVINAQIEASSDLSPGSRVFGFCGLGQPEKFKQTLIDMGFDVAGFKSFADHHPYTDTEIKSLHAQAFEHKAHLITTEKDLCRLPSLENIHIVKIKLAFDDPKKLVALMTVAA